MLRYYHLFCTNFFYFEFVSRNFKKTQQNGFHPHCFSFPNPPLPPPPPIGAPDEEPEQFIKEASARAAMGAQHQYQRSQGAAPLVKSLAKLYSPFLKREIDPMTQIHIGVGATEVGFSAFNTLVNPGDKVVLFEPFFDCYDAWTKIVQATPTYIPLKHYTKQTNPCIQSDKFDQDGILRADDFTFDSEALADALKDARVLLLNTPHNPLGKIFTMKEMEFIAQCVRKNPNLIVISDEVYDFLSHNQTGIEYTVRGIENPHKNDEKPVKSPVTRFATLPDMFQQTLTISSAGKSFNITGWKVGWAIGPQELIKPLSIGHQWISFSVASTLQHALADIIEEAQVNGYFERLTNHYTLKRDKLYKGLFETGLNPIYPSAGYFVVCDGEKLIPRLGIDQNSVSPDELGVVMAEALTTKVGVTSIPVGEFYSSQHKALGNTLLRFAYCKKIPMIDQAIEVLGKWSKDE
jgi:kynurenine--oxoglutarate transaminase/cysteine-S-conjugate beta-lyase/glutamine--phenylpyruvate transaminase